jgi:hypothetical protein
MGIDLLRSFTLIQLRKALAIEAIEACLQKQ